MKLKIQKKSTVNKKIKKPVDMKNGKIMKNENKKIGKLFVKKESNQVYESDENIVDNINEVKVYKNNNIYLYIFKKINN